MGKSTSTLVGSGPDADWRARMDCDTLITAEQITDDPKRYKAALAEAKLRKDALDDVFAEAGQELAEQAASKGKAG